MRISMWSLPPSATRRDVRVRLEDLDVGVGLDVARRALRRPCRRAGRASWCVDVQLERNLLQVEDDVGRVLDHAGNRRELVQHAVDLDRGDRRAFDRGEQHAAQRVADRGAEAALERLRVEPAEPIGQRLALELEPLGSLKTFPEHCVVSFRQTGRYGAPPDLQFRPPPPAAGLERLRAGSYRAFSRQLPDQLGT